MIIKKYVKNKLHEIIIDDDDYIKIKDINLQINTVNNRVSSVFYYYKIETNKWGRKYLSRELMNPPENMQVDHINHNPLDNRKDNLRICTKQQNLQNRRKPNGYSNTYKGVTKEKKYGKYILSFSFDSEIDAKNEYNNLAKKYHKEFALLNK